MDRFSFLNAAHSAFFSDLYDKYLVHPDSVEPSWRSFFQGFDFANEFGATHENNISQGVSNINDTHIQNEIKVLNLIDAFKKHGHLLTKTNPIRERRKHIPTLTVEEFELTSNDLSTTFEAAKMLGLPASTLQTIFDFLQNTFCQHIGVEYSYIRNKRALSWIETKLFQNQNQAAFDFEQKKHILRKLNEAVAFENFLHTKYVGQKRFSLEGAEGTVAALDAMIDRAADLGVEEVVLGMAHRGRLNILANVFQKPTKDIFSEFDGKDYNDDDLFDGDVKYHLGITSDKITPNGKKIKLNLAPNPSHLETVGAVIEGIARAKQDKYYSENPSKVLPIAIHGDAAVAGQGIVYEIVQMAKLDGYKTDGTIHIVINNQVGFTTNYFDARSSTYCTDIAKITLSPVLHVNGDDAEAVVQSLLFAIEYRQEFRSDIFIDIVGYRKYGHNEGDEPRFTQPQLYKLIGKHQNPRDIYAENLIAQGVIEPAYVIEIENAYKAILDDNLEKSRKEQLTTIKPFMQNEWDGFVQGEKEDMLKKYDTSVSLNVLEEISKTITKVPSGMKFISKVNKLINDRKNMWENNQLDWAMGELLAFGSLITEGFDVRMSGQDVERGTFSHRHAVIKIEETEEEVNLLDLLKNKKGEMRIFNSHLSEYGVLGYEYGYSMANPNALTIWEAQFGDFSNGAQIMIDQYISAGEDKWNSQNGVVMLLPHGYENQGAEHSSARMERFLQLCAHSNMFIADCTTPSNLFHLLRRQMKMPFRKPLVVFTPKSLLRHPQAVSTIEEFTNGQFQEVIDDVSANKKEVKTLVFCTGKFYYDLLAERTNLNRNDVAIVRVEQLFPLPELQLKECIASYPNANDYVWAQEEPKNMGAYSFMLMNFDFVKLRLASPIAYSAPAAGSYVRSKKRHADAIAMVFNK